MYQKGLASGRVMAAMFLLLRVGCATVVPPLSFDQLTDVSELVVSGTVTRSWAAWDSEHKYIWTHYELMVGSAHKGAATGRVEFAEPGGTVTGAVMNIAGSVTYVAGDRVAVFLERMPNGYLRTTGWEQGKFNVDAAGRLHPASMHGGESVVSAGSNPAAVATVRALDGITVSEFGQKVGARVRAIRQNGGRQ
jgi:hypothetical protein